MSFVFLHFVIVWLFSNIFANVHATNFQLERTNYLNESNNFSVICIGDSLTVGMTLDKSESVYIYHPYSNYLKNYFLYTNISIFNQARPGSSTSLIYENIETYLSRSASLKYVIILAGTIDILRQFSFTQIKENLDKIHDKIFNYAKNVVKHPIYIISITIPPIALSGTFKDSDRVSANKCNLLLK